jgi:S-DNA-T family DNA segregation ATPase FtsK/SpoIIIE
MGGVVTRIGTTVFWTDYRFIFAPIVTILGGLIVINKLSWNMVRFIGLIMFWISVVSLENIFSPPFNAGLLDFGSFFVAFLWKTPALVFLIGGFLVSLYLTLRISYRKIFGTIHQNLPSMPSIGTVKQTIKDTSKAIKEEMKEDKNDRFYQDKAKELEEQIELLKKSRATPEKAGKELPKHIPIEKKESKGILAGFFGTSDESSKEPISKAKQLSVADIPKKEAHLPDFGKWEFPSINLLDNVAHPNIIDAKEVEQKSLEIQKTLLHFKIDVSMIGEKVWPTVVQYRLKPAEGVKLNRIENLKKDLALSLKAKSIRIQAPIPGVGLVGIEVPNDRRDMVGIREVLENPVFSSHKSNLAMAVGKDINGEYIVADMGKMPHLLIAGQTGSGKSVGMNGFILSLLYKNSPDMLRMIMIDPKRVELGMYNWIPHLLTPVINDPEKALNSLKWSVAEMLRRYDVLQVARARNLWEYNEKVGRKDKMPHIVIIIDELADLMMSGNKKEVESAIARIAQMARAVGMHLIVATQRPSVDIITGLIKANIPSRIAFTVASQIDSRTILDNMGAEDLLGNGDLLYSPVGSSAPERIQGVYVSTEEVEAVVNHIKRTIDPAMLEDIYDASIVDGDRGNFEWAMSDGNGEYDEDPKIVEEAISVVRAEWKASTSMLQRRMKLGYARAARVIDILEGMGIVGPADGSKPREVL